MKFLYHITDFDNLPSILIEGLKGYPVVYLADHPEQCRAIRRIQQQLYEKYCEGSVIFKVDVSEYDLLNDPNSHAWMIYADIPKERLSLLNEASSS